MSYPYPEDVKDRALRLSIKGVTDHAVAETLGIPWQTIAGWRAAAGIKRAKVHDDDAVVYVPAQDIGRRRGGRGRNGAIEVSQELRTFGSVINQRMPIMGSGRYE